MAFKKETKWRDRRRGERNNSVPLVEGTLNHMNHGGDGVRAHVGDLEVSFRLNGCP